MTDDPRDRMGLLDDGWDPFDDVNPIEEAVDEPVDEPGDGLVDEPVDDLVDDLVDDAPIPTVLSPSPSGPIPEVAPARPRRRMRRALTMVRRGLLYLLILAAAAAAGAGVRWLVDRSGDGGPGGAEAPGGPVEPQRVVAWTVWADDDAAYVAVLAEGGGLPPVAVAVPGNTTVSIPGHGLGDVGSAAHTNDVALVATTVESILGIRVDGSVGLPAKELRRLVDDLEGIEVEGERTQGREVVRYLAGAPGSEEERLVRWQEVLEGTLRAASGRPAALSVVPEDVRAVFAAGIEDVLLLPVEDRGAGIARPDGEAIRALVREWFVPTAPGGEEVRLVVLNGNGRPGIGEDVARLLVPQGYRLMSSGNANRFDVRVTRVIASSRADLPAARKAKRTLGVGRVFVGHQPTGLADVTVVVGLDFEEG
jgi:hypothetical protein